MLKYKEAIIYILGAIILVGFTMYKAVPQVIEVFHKEQEIKDKTVQVADLQKQVDDYKAKETAEEAQNALIKKIYKIEIQDIDTESSFALMFDDIMNMTKYCGLKVYSIQYTYNNPEDEFIKNGGGSYNTCQLDLELISDYKDLESFLVEILKYPYLINVNQIKLKAYPKNKKMLLIQLQLILYTVK